MEFATKINDGHYGARKVWRQYLPRLKFHNPTVSMTVNRSTDQAGPATLTVFFSKADGEGVTATTNTESGGRVETIDMKHKQETDILKELLLETGAKEIQATPEEESELRQLAEEGIWSEQDRRRSRLDLETRRREKQMLEQARGLGTAPTTSQS